DDPGQRRLPGPRRSPEDDAADRVLLDQLAQCAARTEQVLLADEVVERARPHACRERRRRVVVRRRFGGSRCPLARSLLRRRLAEQVPVVAAHQCTVPSSVCSTTYASTPATSPPWPPNPCS